jgi:hypothetical protein
MKNCYSRFNRSYTAFNNSLNSRLAALDNDNKNEIKLKLRKLKVIIEDFAENYLK